MTLERGTAGSPPPLVSDVPPPTATHPLWSAALDSVQRAAAEQSLVDLWQDHIYGHFFAQWEIEEADRILLISKVVTSAGRSPACSHEPPCPTPGHDHAIVTRILSGDPQKVVALDLVMAPSTVSTRHVRVLKGMGLGPKQVPLTLVLASQAWAGVQGTPTAHGALFDYQGRAHVVVSIPVPRSHRMAGLTPDLRAVAKLILVGKSRAEIAKIRGTSIHTVARQFHEIYNLESATGRFALVRRAVEQHWFG